MPTDRDAAERCTHGPTWDSSDTQTIWTDDGKGHPPWCARIQRPTDRDAAVDAVMAAVDEHESYGTPADPPESAMFAHQEHRAEDCPTIRAAVEQYGREQYDAGHHDGMSAGWSQAMEQEHGDEADERA